MLKRLKTTIPGDLNNQRGVSLILVALLMPVFLGIAALVIDLGTLYVVRNELQNAADAGALAGARFLYSNQGTYVNVGANQIAYDAATANKSLSIAGVVPVEVNWPDPGADGVIDVQRGHWSFGLGALPRGFYPNEEAEDAPILWNSTTEELDANIDFVNAIQVITRREGTPVASFFARIFNLLNPDSDEDYSRFEVSARAVAYIGFAGSLAPGEVDQPIAICSQSILVNNEYQCNIGRMLNSGSNTATSNTGGWTNFSQPCVTANPSNTQVCGEGNSNIISLGEGMGAVNGVQDNIFSALETCWADIVDSNGDGIPDTTWELTLPVIDCPGNSVSNCAEVLGAVTLKVVWIQRDNPGYRQAPLQMSDTESGINWPSDEDLDILIEELEPFFEDNNSSFPTYDNNHGFPAGTWLRDVFYENTGDNNQVRNNRGKLRWASFVRRFNLRNVGPSDTAPYATFAFKSIYFLPSCQPHEPRGTTGGENFGILARIPVLVCHGDYCDP